MIMKSKYIILISLMLTLLIAFAVCNHLLVSDIKKEKLGQFPYPINNKIFSESNTELEKIIVMGEQVGSYNDFSETVIKESKHPFTDDEVVSLYVNKHRDILEEYNKPEYKEIIFPTSLFQNNEKLSALFAFYKLVLYNIENDIFNCKIENAISQIVKANKQLNDFGKKAPNILSVMAYESLKVFELKTILKLINNEKTNTDQKLKVLELIHFCISKETLIKCVYSMEIYNNSEAKETIKELSKDSFFFKMEAFLIPNLTYSYKPNQTNLLRREYLQKLIVLDEKYLFKDINGLNSAYAIINKKHISNFEPNAFGKREAYIDINNLIHTLRHEIKKNNIIKQLQIAKAIIEYKEKNGELPKNLDELYIDSSALIDNVSGKPFIYSYTYGLLQRIDNKKDRLIIDEIQIKKISNEDIKKDFKDNVFIFKKLELNR